MDITERFTNGPDCYPWREVFAFWPVRTIGGQLIWLKRVYKQRLWVTWGPGYHIEPHVEYATITEILQQ